jgi:ABC-2 type transport system permease protein
VRGPFRTLVGGELGKVVRQRANWPLVLAPAFIVLLPALLSGSGGRPFENADDLAARVLDPLTQAVQVGVGIPLLVIGARTVGQEYQLGTIRVLVARGVGRVRLLLAKLAALAALALAGGVLGIAVGGGALAMAQPQAMDMTLAPGPGLWRDVGPGLAAIGLSLLACALLGMFVASLSRSVVFGLAAALVWFPFENVASIALTALTTVTSQEGYAGLTAYLLGPNLNVLVHAVEPWRRSAVLLATPGLPVDGTHALAVTAAYLAAFLAASIVLTWRRDIHQ